MGLSRAHVAAVASAAAIIVAAAGGTASAASGGVPRADIGHGHRASGHARFPARYINTPVRGYNASRAQRAATAGTTVPLWSKSIISGGVTYHYQMVGKNPFVKQATPSVSIGAPIIPVAFNFASGNAGGNFNPATASCGESLSDISMVQQSPIFTKLTYTDAGTTLGTGEYTDIFQRANFWTYVGGTKKLNPNYHVNLAATVAPTVTINVGTSAGQVIGSGCGATGLVDQIALDSYIRSTLIPSLASVSPTKIPVFIFRNVAMYLNHSTSNCCALGYHSGYTNTSGTPQFYTVTDIDDSGNFTGVQDVSDLAHEIGEWMDDPSGTNPTPAWGHVGQVPNGCQSNLEVGDPLTNTNLSITAANGLTYHPQELTFFSWFYRQKPSIGVNGFYSLAGSFTTPSKVCT